MNNNLFGHEEKTPKRAEPMPEYKSQWVSNTCECGAKGGAYLYHYQAMVCPCGVRYWALRPKRNGPLVAVKHPGFILHPEEFYT